MYYPIYEPIPGEPHEIGTEAETLEMIREVLAKELKASRKPWRPKRENRTIEVFDAYYAAKERDARHILTQPITKAELAFPEIDELPETERRAEPAEANLSVRPTRRVEKRRWSDFRLGRRHLLLSGFVALALVWPIWVGIVLLSGIALSALLFWLAGPSRVWAGTLLALHRLGQRDPERARRMRMRMDRIAARWDRILDLFPTGSVDALYMPDFHALATADDHHSRAMSHRLSKMVESQ